jgi:hypothetical protein
MSSLPLKPSEVFHDLRKNNTKRKEIGILKVEVLECRGLPKLDYASKTDGVIYFVCGSYAFVTDVIWNRLNPIWPAKSRRACAFPLFDGFAHLFAGVFDDDGENYNDNFAGRVVLDLARCWPRSTYDITLPLRTSTHVYTKQPRGAIRLRFSIEWNSERDALLSYIPNQIRMPRRERPNDDVTVLCGDEKAFRNVAFTVHGTHMPGRFSLKHMRATLEEIDFTRKRVVVTIQQLVLDIMFWKVPVFSALVFIAWIHAVFTGSFSLVPAYGGLFLSTILMSNYFVFGTGGSLHNGFVPPSWEEMLLALTRTGKSHSIEPLEMNSRRGTSQEYFKTRAVTYQPIGLEINK